MTQTVEHYRIIQTYFTTGSTPYSPALAARPSSSSVSRHRARAKLSLDDCMGIPPHRLIGIVAAKEADGQHILAHLQSHGQSPTHAGALRSRLPSSGSRRNARVDRNANGCSWLGTRQSFRGRPASLGRAILLQASCSHCAWTPPSCSSGPPPTVQYGLQQAFRGLQASGSVVQVQGRPHCPSPPHPCPLDEEHMSTQYKDTNRTHTYILAALVGLGQPARLLVYSLVGGISAVDRERLSSSRTLSLKIFLPVYNSKKTSTCLIGQS